MGGVGRWAVEGAWLGGRPAGRRVWSCRPGGAAQTSPVGGHRVWEYRGG